MLCIAHTNLFCIPPLDDKTPEEQMYEAWADFVSQPPPRPAARPKTTVPIERVLPTQGSSQPSGAPHDRPAHPSVAAAASHLQPDSSSSRGQIPKAVVSPASSPQRSMPLGEIEPPAHSNSGVGSMAAGASGPSHSSLPLSAPNAAIIATSTSEAKGSSSQRPPLPPAGRQAQSEAPVRAAEASHGARSRSTDGSPRKNIFRGFLQPREDIGGKGKGKGKGRETTEEAALDKTTPAASASIDLPRMTRRQAREQLDRAAEEAAEAQGSDDEDPAAPTGSGDEEEEEVEAVLPNPAPAQRAKGAKPKRNAKKPSTRGSRGGGVKRAKRL